jgi:hypothetical protein
MTAVSTLRRSGNCAHSGCFMLADGWMTPSLSAGPGESSPTAVMAEMERLLSSRKRRMPSTICRTVARGPSSVRAGTWDQLAEMGSRAASIALMPILVAPTSTPT